MDVVIVDFPETMVAVAEHRGPPELEYETSRKLVEWRMRNGVPPLGNRTYGVHHTDPFSTPPADHRVDFCVTYDGPIASNPEMIVQGVIPACQCAMARHLGSRSCNRAAIFLAREWLPKSGRLLGDFPMFFHYVNVGPNIQDDEMITDVYLPLRPIPRVGQVHVMDASGR